MQTNTPNLENLILTNNRVENLLEVDNLVGLKKLHTLSFLKNPITRQPNYRKYIIFKLPWIKVLDFTKVKAQVSLSFYLVVLFSLLLLIHFS